MSETTLEVRMSKIEAKHEAIEIFLPALLNRFEHTETDIKADLHTLLNRFEHAETDIKADLRASRWERRALVVAVAAIPLSFIGALVLLFLK